MPSERPERVSDRPFPDIAEVRHISLDSVVGGGNGGGKKKALMVSHHKRLNSLVAGTGFEPAASGL